MSTRFGNRRHLPGSSGLHEPDDSKPTMSLVLYSDSESDEQDKSEPLNASGPISKNAHKRKRSGDDHTVSLKLPPLPATFHDLYSTNARISTSDDPSLHGGRKRAIPHIEGNWPSHVYLEWLPSQTESEKLHKLLDNIRISMERENQRKQRPLAIPGMTPSLLSPLGAPLPLHISLSRTLQIKTDEREAFLETLSSSIRRSAVKSFPVGLSMLKWVPNFERNRWFVVLGVQRPPHDELNRLLDACNDAAERSGHPGLYIGGKGDGPMENNSSNNGAKKRRTSAHKGGAAGTSSTSVDRSDHFHISIAWNLKEPDLEWIALINDLNVAEVIGLVEIPFDAVKARIGNNVHNIDLDAKKSRRRSGAGLIGLG